jgi:hypothetical protein
MDVCMFVCVCVCVCARARLYVHTHTYTGCPTRYRTRHFFNNFTTNEDIATKFKADLPHCVRNVKEKNVLLFKFRCNIFICVRIIKEMPGSVASGTLCIISSDRGATTKPNYAKPFPQLYWHKQNTIMTCIRLWHPSGTVGSQHKTYQYYSCVPVTTDRVKMAAESTPDVFINPHPANVENRVS